MSDEKVNPKKKKATKAKKTTKVTEEPKVENNTDSTAADPTLEVLRNKLEQMKEESSRNLELAQRAQAELENVRNRTEKDIVNARKFALENFMNALLPALDSLDKGIETFEEKEELKGSAVTDGIKMTAKMLVDILQKFGVQVIDPQGEKFNPQLHEALSAIPQENTEANTIVQVIQKGYSLNERVIRPARVIIVR